MFRITGFVLGAALAISAMLILLGMPTLPSPEPERLTVQPPLEVAPEKIVVEPPPALPERVETVAEPEPIAAEPQWHSFWSPFASQIAANGFVSRLEAVTGYDYRVVKIGTGVFEVTFAYTDEAERLDKLSAIAAATGLMLPDS